ncbi:BT_3987 domain-containing protein [Muribaculum intestinale]|uniref:BT_3987 domain-containing protein n=1 Tax=Muribaculum intestinale TaxID=1796646 RepID=UPI0025A99828|nr:DUF1735 domain-containing protein [Muribaculum intestinale]
MKTKYLLGICALAIGSVAMTSCGDDDTYDVVGNPDTLVYVNIAGDFPEGMPKNSFTYVLYHTPIGPVVMEEPGDIEIDVMCTKNAPSDMQVTLEVAPDMSVPGYATIPADAGITVTLASNSLTIPAGKNRSDDKIAVTVNTANADWSKLTEKAYLLPIRISSASGATPSRSVGCAYIGVLTDVKAGMVNESATQATGTQITDKTDWTASYYVPATGAGADCTDKLFDGNNNNYAYFVPNHADATNEEVITTFDLGKVYTLSSVQINYFGNYYAIKDGTIETSVDGEEWTVQGTRTWSRLSRNCAFAFWAPFQMRYVRLTSHSFYGGTGEGQAMAEFWAYE